MPSLRTSLSIYLPSSSGKSHRNVYSVTLWPAPFSSTSGFSGQYQGSDRTFLGGVDLLYMHTPPFPPAVPGEEARTSLLS